MDPLPFDEVACPADEEFGLAGPGSTHDELWAIAVGNGIVPIVGTNQQFGRHAFTVPGGTDTFVGSRQSAIGN